MDWNEYLIVAQELARGNTQGHYRAAISRAYYAAYNIIREKFRYTAVSKDVHQAIISHLKSSPNDKIVTIGLNLGILRDKRNQADYHNKNTYTQAHANHEIGCAQSIIRLVDIILKEEEEKKSKKS